MSESLSPLDERVDAPRELPVLEHPDVAVWRPAAVDDLDALMEAQAAIDAADHPTHATTREWVAEQLTSSAVDNAADTIVGFDRSGGVVAYGAVVLHPLHDTRLQVYLMGGVHPEHRGRGIGRQLFAWQHARAQQQLAATSARLPGWVMAYEDEGNADAVSVAKRTGLKVARYFTTMVREVGDPIPELMPPEGVEIRAFGADVAEETRLARNDAFRDHWGSQPTATERWGHFTGAPNFRNELSRVAVETATGRVVAFCLVTVNEADWAAQGFTSGYIELVGVVRDFRRQGLAPATIAATLAALRTVGYERAILDVDSESPTGADTLYTNLGFRPDTREVALVAAY